MYTQPILTQHGPIAEGPLYLYVPPGHSKNWRRYCGCYNACGRPVYFVQVTERNRWWTPPHGGYDRRDDRDDRSGGDKSRDGRGHRRGGPGNR